MKAEVLSMKYEVEKKHLSPYPSYKGEWDGALIERKYIFSGRSTAYTAKSMLHFLLHRLHFRLL